MLSKSHLVEITYIPKVFLFFRNCGGRPNLYENLVIWMTKYICLINHNIMLSLGSYKKKCHSLTFLEVNTGSRCYQIRYLVRALFQIIFCYIFTWQEEREQANSLVPFYKDQWSHHEDSSLWSRVNLIPPKGHISKYHHFGEQVLNIQFFFSGEIGLGNLVHTRY